MAGTRSNLPNPPSLIENNNYRFLIFDAPNDDNLPIYIHEFKRFNVRKLVRACDPTYAIDQLRSANIAVHDMPFPDGGFPSDDVVDKWLALLRGSFKDTENETIGVHCVAGLGRAPVLVAIALIESGMDPFQAVEYIRSRRKNSINRKQLEWLKNYKPRKGKGRCNIM